MKQTIMDQIDKILTTLFKMIANECEDDEEYIATLKITKQLINQSIDTIINETKTDKNMN